MLHDATAVPHPALQCTPGTLNGCDSHTVYVLHAACSNAACHMAPTTEQTLSHVRSGVQAPEFVHITAHGTWHARSCWGTLHETGPHTSPTSITPSHYGTHTLAPKAIDKAPNEYLQVPGKRALCTCPWIPHCPPLQHPRHAGRYETRRHVHLPLKRQLYTRSTFQAHRYTYNTTCCWPQLFRIFGKRPTADQPAVYGSRRCWLTHRRFRPLRPNQHHKRHSTPLGHHGLTAACPLDSAGLARPL